MAGSSTRRKALLNAGEVERLRGARQEFPNQPREPQGVTLEWERSAGSQRLSGTLFLTGAECPFRCVFCDLWQYTLLPKGPELQSSVGTIAAQIEVGLQQLQTDALRRGAPLHSVKLYNASNFFDPRAVPVEDDDAILRALGAARPLQTVVECHPKVLLSKIGQQRARRYAEDAALQVALGLETVAPGGVELLGKGARLEDFERAFEFCHSIGAEVRVFVLFGIPTEQGARDPAEELDRQLRWMADSLRWSRDRGAHCATVIPVRGGNGAMELLMERGQWAAPTLDDFAQATRRALELGGAGFEVLIDCWDLDRLAGGVDAEEVRSLLQQANRDGRFPISVGG